MNNPNRVSPRPAAVGGVVVAEVVVDEAEVGVVDFAAPLDGLVYLTLSGNGAVGGVGVGGGELSFCGVEFADVFGEVPAIGVPGACLLDGQRAGGGGLGGVPEDGVFCGVGE